MGEIPKKIQSGDRPDIDTHSEEEDEPPLKVTLTHVDFVSKRGVLRAYEARPGRLEVAPHDSEVWGDYSKELGRRASQTVIHVGKVLDDAKTL